MSFTSNTTNARLTRILADLLLETPVGRMATYERMNGALGFDARTRFWLIASAKRLANEESGAIFNAERNVGYRRLPPSEAHALGRQARLRMRRISGVTSKFITKAMVLTNDMPDEDRRKIHTELAALGLLRHLTLDRHLPRDPGERPVPTVDSVRRSIDALRQSRAAPPP